MQLHTGSHPCSDRPLGWRADNLRPAARLTDCGFFASVNIWKVMGKPKVPLDHCIGESVGEMKVS